MALTEELKDNLYSKCVRYASSKNESYGDFSKSQLRSVIDLGETELVSCYVSFNNSLSANIKAGLIKKQKVRILVNIMNTICEEDS